MFLRLFVHALWFPLKGGGGHRLDHSHLGGLQKSVRSMIMMTMIMLMTVILIIIIT